MKNICTRLLLPKIKTPIKTNRAMKLTCALLLTASMGVFATGNAQTMRVNIQADNVSTEKILSEIEKQTDYLFVYNKKEVDREKRVSMLSTKQLPKFYQPSLMVRISSMPSKEKTSC